MGIKVFEYIDGVDEERNQKKKIGDEQFLNDSFSNEGPLHLDDSSHADILKYENLFLFSVSQGFQELVCIVVYILVLVWNVEYVHVQRLFRLCLVQHLFAQTLFEIGFP